MSRLAKFAIMQKDINKNPFMITARNADGTTIQTRQQAETVLNTYPEKDQYQIVDFEPSKEKKKK